MAARHGPGAAERLLPPAGREQREDARERDGVRSVAARGEARGSRLGLGHGAGERREPRALEQHPAVVRRQARREHERPAGGGRVAEPQLEPGPAHEVGRMHGERERPLDRLQRLRRRLGAAARLERPRELRQRVGVVRPGRGRGTGALHGATVVVGLHRRRLLCPAGQPERDSPVRRNEPSGSCSAAASSSASASPVAPVASSAPARLTRHRAASGASSTARRSAASAAAESPWPARPTRRTTRLGPSPGTARPPGRRDARRRRSGRPGRTSSTTRRIASGEVGFRRSASAACSRPPNASHAQALARGEHRRPVVYRIDSIARSAAATARVGKSTLL